MRFGVLDRSSEWRSVETYTSEFRALNIVFGCSPFVVVANVGKRPIFVFGHFVEIGISHKRPEPSESLGKWCNMNQRPRKPPIQSPWQQQYVCVYPQGLSSVLEETWLGGVSSFIQGPPASLAPPKMLVHRYPDSRWRSPLAERVRVP